MWIALAFVVGLVLGRLTARFALSLERDDPDDHNSEQRLLELRRKSRCPRLSSNPRN
jgi:hypothetical protein